MSCRNPLNSFSNFACRSSKRDRSTLKLSISSLRLEFSVNRVLKCFSAYINEYMHKLQNKFSNKVKNYT